MGFFGSGRGWVGAGGWALVWAALAGADAASTHTTKRPVVLSAWELAQHGREALEAQAEGTRTKAAYARVLDEYRAIYHDNPADVHAADAVNAVAEVLGEEGREFDDAKSLRAAVGQYEFLRTQYPASGLRTTALLAEGKIEAEDLGEAGEAREKFEAVMKEAPRSAAARQARVELGGLRAGSAAGLGAGVPTHRDETAMNGARGSEKPEGLRDDRQGLGIDKQGQVTAAAPGRTTLAAVTGIRHWSTSTYTRVAIDLGDEVTFEAARVPNPDRIYFDLHGARLGAELVGKSFEVTDDGFLKRIRAAQAGGDVTRVVLDVNDVTEYSAFLLPNPYRLIIDIHGGTKARDEGKGKKEEKAEVAEVPVAAAAVREASAAANVSGLPAMAPTDGGEMVRPAGGAATKESGRASLDAHVSDSRHGAPATAVIQTKPVPNSVARPGTSGEVAAVSESPGRVEATSAPTSKPIAATVKGRVQPANAQAPGVQPINLGTNGTATSGAGASDMPVVKTRRGAATALDAAPVKAAEKTADGETSLVRALGLKIGRIVIDAGHGGHDSGTLGVDGIQEKDVVLDVALRLGKLLHDRLGAEIIYTRSDDTFIPLETRTAIANKAQADLFLSIHANSSEDETARGVETYYLNFTSDASALDVAARENAVGGQSVHQLSDLVKKIALKDKIAESREFAADVESSLYAGLERGNAGLKNRGVKKAPFVVLIGANMPSILAEISFVTNAKDAAQLREPEYRQRVAESLYTGVAKYEAGLAGAKPAQVKRAALQ